jgi:hypothetical protein
MPTLDWLDRDHAFTLADRVPTRLLEQVSVHHADAGAAIEAQNDNLLIQGDNLEALKALLPFYRGEVKCIFIDPPYNTKSAFEHYDDNLEHSQWLSMMLPRLQLLRELLREDGSIWVTIDDNEGHYLKVLMDEVFGRSNSWPISSGSQKTPPGTTQPGLRKRTTTCTASRATQKRFDPACWSATKSSLRRTRTQTTRGAHGSGRR